MKSFKLPFLFSLLFWSACTIGPTYRQPTLSLPSTYVSLPSPSALSGEEASALQAWWMRFDDPKLASLIQEARTQNLDFKIALEKINEARFHYQVKAADLAPKIDMTAEQRRLRISQTLFDSTLLGPSLQSFYAVGFDASWEIDLFGKIRREKEKAFYQYGAQREQAKDVYITLLGEVARNYITVRASQKELSLTKRQIDIYNKRLELTEALLEAGLSSDVDLQNIYAALENASSTAPLLETEIQHGIYTLAVLLGKAPEGFAKELKEESVIPVGKLPTVALIPSELLRRRPDIRRAEQELAAATAQVGSAIADLFPRFFLFGSYSFQSSHLYEWLQGKSRSYSFGPTVDWPLLYFGRIKENIRAQNSVQEQALLAYEKSVLNALAETEKALTSYYKESERRTKLQQELGAKQQVYQLTFDLYLSGLTDFQTLLQSDEACLKAEKKLATSTKDMSLFLVAVYKALGGQW